MNKDVIRVSICVFVFFAAFIAAYSILSFAYTLDEVFVQEKGKVKLAIVSIPVEKAESEQEE